MPCATVSRSSDELKREVAGEIVTIGLDGLATELYRLLERLPFVRDASIDDGLLRVYVEQGESALPAILRVLDRAGLAPDRIGLHRPSLDDVFLAKTGRSLRDDAAA